MLKPNRKLAKSLIICGTGSGVGKTLLTTALCHIFYEDGYTVAPFKAKNISLNSGVTKKGQEIAIAQIGQAEAAGVIPSAAMNPILIKPQAKRAPQVIINGKPANPRENKIYLRPQKQFEIALKNLNSLRKKFSVVIIEGTGSPAEPNFIKQNLDLKIAKHTKSPIVLVGNIEKGGVFAALEGTVAILKRHDPEAAILVKGFIINNFSGKKKNLTQALRDLERTTGIPTLGVIPRILNHNVPEEDIFEETTTKKQASIDIAVIRFPYTQNSQDLDPLIKEKAVRIRFVSQKTEFGEPDLVVLPGSKSTQADLNWVRVKGLGSLIKKHAQKEKAIIGICGGFQMLGIKITDPHHMESEKNETNGLGLIPVQTTFSKNKIIKQTRRKVLSNTGLLKGARCMIISGYELHMGRTPVKGGLTTNKNGWVVGTYLHGIFENDSLRSLILKNIAVKKGVKLPKDRHTKKADKYAYLANLVRRHTGKKLLKLDFN